MHLQPQKGIPPAIPKDPIDDHETYLCPRTLQKNPHLSSTTADLLRSPSAIANLYISKLF